MDPSPSPPADDALLLRCYVREGSEAAFRALAERHLPLVWNVARRVVNGDAAMAEDVAQIVLADFARKAPSLPPGTIAAAWLHRHTVFTASKAVRSEVRRRARELRSTADEMQTGNAMNASSDLWTDLAPHIDTALDRLSAADRSAVILRYYEQRPLREVGRAIGLTEEAARKRIDRALTKLRSHLKRRGVVPAAAIFAALLRDSSTAAPSTAVSHRILSGAWHQLEAGALSSASTLVPWWRRRSVVAGATLVLFAGLLWMLNYRGMPATENNSGLLSHPVLPDNPVVPASLDDGPSLTLTATLISLPEKNLAARMLRYTPGRDDAALYRELLPEAQGLQKEVNPDETFATTGHPLVILTGLAKTKKITILPPRDPRGGPAPAPADPFANPPPPRPVFSIKIGEERDFPYATEWSCSEETGEVKGEALTARSAGSLVEADVSVPDMNGVCLIECGIDHMFAPPEHEYWRYRVAPDNEDPDRYSTRQPVFHSFQCHFGPAAVRPGEPVLAAMTALPADLQPQSGSGPARLFVFITLQP